MTNKKAGNDSDKATQRQGKGKRKAKEGNAE
jgi:hypothetical protein